MQRLSVSDISRVDCFTISNECVETYPCYHQCEIKFKDGTKHTVDLPANEIHEYIEKLPLNKVNSTYDLRHFQ